MKNFILTLAFCTVLQSGFAQSETTAIERKAAYVPAGSVNAERIIGPPWAMNSAGFREQMAIVLWLQKSRSPEQIVFVQKALDLTRFAPLLSKEFLGINGIWLSELVDEIIDEIRADYDAIKAKYDVPRPFVVNEQIKPVMDARRVASYPSGHAIRAVVYARLLGDIFPDHQEALMDLALQIGYGRVTAGVHYPMDVIAGQKLGNAYADVILKQPAYREAVDRIRGKQPE